MSKKPGDNPYLNNVSIEPEFIGLTGLLNPMGDKVSASRADMFASHSSQFRIPNDGESPDIFTGFESYFADYCFDSTARRNDVKILAIVPKYQMTMGVSQIQNNPMITVLYRDLETGELGYFNLSKYTKCSDGYGYQNIGLNLTNLVEGSVLDQDTKLYESVAHKGGEYRYGTNANVAFMTLPETVEDAFLVSESLVNKLATTDISTVSIKIDLGTYPLNLYGDQDEYKIFPDIGDYVREDGVICAFRSVNDFSIISDLNAARLQDVNHLHDNCIYGNPGAQVIDVNVFVGGKSKIPTMVFDQVQKYNESKLNYFRTILDVYEANREIPMDGKFNTLITRAMAMLLVAKRKVRGVNSRSSLKLIGKHNVVNLIVEITTMNTVIPNLGFKSTGREGGKGVICAIKPDNEMPIDEQGFRADIAIDPMAVVKRTNISQLFEQFLNRVCKLVSMRLKDLPDDNAKFASICEVLHDINPNFAALVQKTYTLPADRATYIKYCEDNTIKVNVPPTLNTLTSDLVLHLNEKYKADASPVTFVIEDAEGNKKEVTTKSPVMIGSKFIMLLYKYPKAMSPGFGFLNQFHIPVRTSRKNRAPISQTPVRFGEDENRILTASVGPEATVRLRCLLGTSDVGRDKLLTDLLKTRHPSRISKVNISTKELQDSDFMLSIINNLFNTAGIDVQNTMITEKKANEMFKLLEHS